MTAPSAHQTSGALFRALRSVDVDPTLAFEATEETRRQAGQNVIDVLGSKIDSLDAKIDTLQRVVWRVIWPLIGLLATTVFGLLYQAVIRS